MVIEEPARGRRSGDPGPGRRTGRATILLLLCLFALADPGVANAGEARADSPSVFAHAAQAVSRIFFFEIPVMGISVPPIVVILMVSGLAATIYFGFANLRLFRFALEALAGRHGGSGDPGQTSQFQATASSLSATIGLGNIAGVAVSVAIGGPGAIGWIVIAGLFGMSLKFLECTVAVKYRVTDARGEFFGGPMYYLESIFAARHCLRLGWLAARVYCVALLGAVFIAGTMFQTNQAYSQLLASTGATAPTLIGGLAYGGVAALVVGLSIAGGIRSIARVLSRLVPLMVAFYILAVLVILGANAAKVPEALAIIVSGMIDPYGVAGGAFAVMIEGIKRSVFSNEAGAGTATMYHATARTDDPVRQGLVAMLEPFWDSVVMCTATGLVIVVTGAHHASHLPGIAMTSEAFRTVAAWFPWMLAVAVVLFALSTTIAVAYAGLAGWRLLFGDSRVSVAAYKLSICAVIVVAPAAHLLSIIALADVMFFAMILLNITGLVFVAPEIRRDLRAFLRRRAGARPCAPAGRCGDE